MRAVARLPGLAVAVIVVGSLAMSCAPAPPARPPAPTRIVTPAVRVTPGSDVDGEAIAHSLQISGLPVVDVRTFNAETDPERLLGRANQYSARVSWRDRRGGGDASAEAFPTIASFQARKALLEARNARDGTLAEYIYDRAERRVLLRLPRALTPAEAAEYEAWLSTI